MKTSALLCVISVWAAHVDAMEWSATELQGLYGTAFQEPFNNQDVAKGLVTLAHAGGYSWGSSFAFVDYLRSDADDAHADEFYGEIYLYPSLSRWSGRALSAGPIRDVSLTLGINYGDKSNGANPRVFLPGLTVHFAVPGFSFLDLGLTGYLDRGRFNGAATTCNADTWQLTPSWKHPFKLAGRDFSFSGFVDVIGAHGACARQVLSQPQLRMEIGDWFGRPGKVQVGVEYQYWRNKFGIDGLHEHFPQALLAWGF